MQHVTQTFGLLLLAHVIPSAYLPGGAHEYVSVYNKNTMLLTKQMPLVLDLHNDDLQAWKITPAAPKSRDFILKSMRLFLDSLLLFVLFSFKVSTFKLKLYL